MATLLRQAHRLSGSTQYAAALSFQQTKNSSSTPHVAVVGSGPSGFYFVDRLRRLLGGNVNVDVFDRLPSPFGLVRYGVAPDHPDTKNVVNKFRSIATEEGVRFFGNVHVGRDVPVSVLMSHYSAVVLACGAEDDKHMNISGEESQGLLSAREFVAWYNGHPDYVNVPVDLHRVRSVGIVGLGNVALDCARILLRPADELVRTDISDHALEQLRCSSVENVHIIGRRGPLQAQFSGKELREILTLSNITVSVHPTDYQPTTADAKEPRKAQKGFQELLKAHGKASTKSPWRHLQFHFLSSPVAAVCSDEHSISHVTLQPQLLQADSDGSRQTFTPNGEPWDLPVDLLLRSVGYKGRPVPGFPFDMQRGIIPNQLGRVCDAASGEIMPGMYVAGWIKRGAQGIIGTNLVDAEQTARCVVEDLYSLQSCEKGLDIQEFLQDSGIEFVTWDGWLKIDAEEQRQGEAAGRPRRKITDKKHMLQVANS